MYQDAIVHFTAALACLENPDKPPTELIDDVGAVKP
jgi:hypothetical protein